jgi:hypothetical protein
LLQINAIGKDVDPSFDLNPTTKSPCKESPGAASPESKSPCKESPGAASAATPVETPRKTKRTTKTTTTRTNTARSFDEKEQVTKYKVSQTANFD